jgi:predicted AlkP superfamily pyrophosphatase or phosphodiesterase
MKRFLIPLCIAMMPLSTVLRAEERTQPKLVVQITMDQFRADYLQRYQPAFSGGLKTLMEKGRIDAAGQVDHAITNSYPGHGSLATGSYPAHHGYPANEWWDFVDGKWRWVDGAVDPKTHYIGEGNERLAVSNTNLRRRTLGDWIKKSDANSKSINLGSGATTAIYGGWSSDGAYWYDRAAGKYVTSSYFIDQYPDWIRQFNETELAKFKLEAWHSIVPQCLMNLTAGDDNSYESFGNHYTFPHLFAEEYDPSSERSRDEQLNYWFYETPMADLAVFSLAKKAVLAEKLGQGEAVDYLSLSLEVSDNIGHIYGAYSVEILDALLRMDTALADFLSYLDATVGPENYILALSGDHGAPDPIEKTLAEGRSAFRIPTETLDALLDRVDAVGEAHKGNVSTLIDKIEALLEAEPYVEDAVTEAEVMGDKPSTNPFLSLYRNSWVRGRVADFPLWTTKPNRVHHPARYGIYAQFKENTHFSYGVVVHGSPYSYDRTVPIIFYGAGVKAGKSSGYRTIDVAPTLAGLAGVQVPNDIDGRLLDVSK